ncbi:MAG: HEAT repeat domain-containing protein [Melioribacteraceae bacterium]|nr:HEAT repeat domain-containing protein [Melioribacteraceae bacterium]
MQEKSLDLKEEVSLLNSEDPAIRREAAEKYTSINMPEEIAKVLAEKLLDPDNGVRDAVCQSLILNDYEKIPNYVVPYTGSTLEISTRNLAGEILLRRGVTAIPAMVAFIDEGDDDDKKFIIDLLGLIGDLSPAAKIVEVLRKTENENVALACFEALGNIRSDEEVEELESFYGKNELYKPTIIEALGKIGSDRAVNFIIEKYAVEDELTKFSMIESLGLIGNEQAFFMLVGELEYVTGALTWAAISTLKKLRDKYGLDVPFDEHMKNAILATLTDAEIEYKRAAANLITEFEDKEIVETCLNLYGKDEEIDYNIKSRFFDNPAFSFPKIADYLKQKPQHIKELLELVSEIIQRDGGQCLGELNDMDFRNLGDAFSISLDDPDEEVRRYSIELLFFINPETALVFLDTMLGDDNYWNRLRVLEILENFEDERANNAIKKLAEDQEEMVREKAQELVSQRNL